MFPTNVEQHYQQRNRRRGRNDPNNRDYICPCGKSYLSYPALFTHIKTKHNGRAPGQIIKPKPQNSRRGRPNKARQIYDSDSQTEDIASNSLDRLCDYVLSTEIEKPQLNLKEIFLNDAFYEIYANYNQQQQQPKYNENQDLYQQTCQNVFSQFLAEIHKKLNEPFFIDVLFLFVMMLARGINKKNNNDQQIKQQPIQHIVEYVNIFLLDTLPQFKETFKISQIQLFKIKPMAKLIQYFYNWLTMKKYLAVKVKVNDKYFEQQ